MGEFDSTHIFVDNGWLLVNASAIFEYSIQQDINISGVAVNLTAGAAGAVDAGLLIRVNILNFNAVRMGLSYELARGKNEADAASVELLLSATKASLRESWAEFNGLRVRAANLESTARTQETAVNKLKVSAQKMEAKASAKQKTINRLQVKINEAQMGTQVSAMQGASTSVDLVESSMSANESQIKPLVTQTGVSQETQTVVTNDVGAAAIETPAVKVKGGV